ncbi:MAG: hypothetical protein IT423_05255 [Pirellulaceae bacterium]|nr:hypothetical protein [Pirellulaceae bacterium]
MVRLMIGLVLIVFTAAIWVKAVGNFHHHLYAELIPESLRETTLEQRTSDSVSPQDRQQLQRATRFRDEILFAGWGLLVGGIIGTFCGRFSTRSQLKSAGVSGAILGALAGALTAYSGHAFQSNVTLDTHPAVLIMARTFAMFLPMALAMGVAASISGIFNRDLADGVVGAVVGLLIGAVVFGFLSYADPQYREQPTDILPTHTRNLALIGTLPLFMCLMIGIRMRRKPKWSQFA